MIKIAITVYVFLNIKKLVLTEDDTIVTQIYYAELTDEPPISLVDIDVLIFWNIQHSSGHLSPIFLNEENIDKYVHFDYVQRSLNFEEDRPDDFVPYVKGKVR